MDPEAMNPFALAVARGIGRAHCTGRPYSEADLARRLPSRRNQPHARVARAMKPSPPAFGCPNANTCDLTARGSRTAGFASPPSFPGDEATRRHGALAQRNVSTIRLPERSSRSRCTGRLHVGDAVGAPVARNTGGLPSHRLLERWDRAPPPGYPSSRTRPTALIRFAKPSPPHGCPLGAADLTARMPMLEALHFDSVARVEAFPRHAVTCVTSGSRCDRLTSWSPR
jgi:hypothetical protein